MYIVPTEDERHFVDGDWLIDSCFCVSLCSVLYYIQLFDLFIFLKTLVNAQPLNPATFEEFAAH